jgi:hypothetical protein
VKRFSIISALVVMALVVLITGCGPDVDHRTSDQKQQADQEKILQEGTAQSGMPNIKNFRERKLLKDILEMRDQDGLVTYTYLFAENTGKACFLGDTIGYGIPYATQYTSPQRPAKMNETDERGNMALPQADPNGLFSPAAAEGTWILMKDPDGKDVRPQYIEPRIMTFTFKLKGAEPCVPGGQH